jgi:hypothetical protein
LEHLQQLLELLPRFRIHEFVVVERSNRAAHVRGELVEEGLLSPCDALQHLKRAVPLRPVPLSRFG